MELDQDPNNIGVMADKGKTLLLMSKPTTAMECFDEAMSYEPLNYDLWICKGQAMEQLGKIGIALTCFEKGIMIAPKVLQGQNTT
jgi:tetratricopeptide (TPR) repeat protein